MSSGPYLKVPYAPKVAGSNTRIATVEEVRSALPTDVEGLTVDEALRYPCVNFPEGTTYATMKKVNDHLKSQGFEVEL